MRRGRKLLLSWLVLVGSVLLLRVDGWFGLGFVVALPLVILYWFDLGHELRSSPAGRWQRVAGLLMGVPQALFGMVCAAAGVAILYNSFWTRDANYSGGFLTFGLGPVLVLFGAGFVVDAFRRASTFDEA